MDFSLVPVADTTFLNFIYLGLASNSKTLIAMFNTRGNTMVKESIAKDLDIKLLDTDYIDDKKTYKRAILGDLLIGGLKLSKVPVLVAKDTAFDLGADPFGNTNDCDMVLGWNVISQFAWRANPKEGRFEVQISDFMEVNKQKTNQPIINIGFNGRIIKAAIDTSRPLTIISPVLAKEAVDSNTEVKETLSMLGESIDDVTNLSRFTFTNDNKEVSLGLSQIEKDLANKDIQVVFGADLLRSTNWAIYGPTGYIRLENF
ncbi:hypothetical protein [uncultured Anaerococcus sp.]|uniref:hypothetical protein n=1 Tax=uncultured Anaerococcus sp. TaxID=293428 RepID=UPI00288C5635|nr:hypothetical protein [uncultured Anaerococcus sp.]